MMDRVDLEMVYELPFIHSNILEARQKEKELKADSLARVKGKTDNVDTTAMATVAGRSDTSVSIAANDSLKVESTTFVPNRTIEVPSYRETEPDVFSWEELTPEYLLSLPGDSLLVDVIPGKGSSDMVSTLRSNIQSMRDQVSYRSKQLNADNKKVIKSTYELHFKYALAISCILFVLVGGAMGSIVRKGGFGYSLLISIVFFVIFIMMTILFRKTSEGGRLSPVLAAYLPVLILLPVGLFLVYKAVKDSKLALDFERVGSWINKLWERRKRFVRFAGNS